MNKYAHSIARYLLSQRDTRSAEFWKEHWPTIRELKTAILDERLLFFKRDATRSNGIQLLIMTDLIWQVARGLSGMKGDDEKWLARYLPAGYEQMVAADHPDNFENDKQIVADLTWVYGQHSALRHPADQMLTWSWMFEDPWPSCAADRLARAAEAAAQILSFFVLTLDPNTGFEGEILETQRLARAAEQNVA